MSASGLQRLLDTQVHKHICAYAYLCIHTNTWTHMQYQFHKFTSSIFAFTIVSGTQKAYMIAIAEDSHKG